MSDFFTASAKYMEKQGGFTYSEALQTLYTNVETLRSTGSPFMVFGAYVLLMMPDDDGVEDFYLSKKISSYTVFPEEGVVESYAHTDGVDLPAIDSDL